MGPRFIARCAWALLGVAVLSGGTATGEPPDGPPKPLVERKEPAWILALESESDRAWMRRLLDPDDELRRATVNDLFRLEDKAPLELERRLAPAFSLAFKTGDVATRVAAARSMGRIGYTACDLLMTAFADPAPEVRAAVARAVRDLATFSSARCPQSLPGLIRLLDDPDWRVRAAAPDGVGVYGGTNSGRYSEGRAALPRVLALASDEHAEVRLAAIQALSWMTFHDARSSVEAAFETALGDVDPSVRAAAADWFASEADVRVDLGRSPLIPASVRPTLRRLLSDSEPKVRWGAASTLWTVEGKAEGLVPILADQVRARWDVTRPLALLTEIGPEAQAAVPAIISILGLDTSDHFTPGGQAVDALFAIGPDPSVALPLLTVALEDPDPARRTDAARAVASVDRDPVAAARVLDVALESEQVDFVRAEIWESLGRVGVAPDRLTGRLVAAFGTSDAETSGALRGLVRLGRPGAGSADALRVLLGKEGLKRHRDEAAWALGAVGGLTGAAFAAAQVGRNSWVVEDLERILESAEPSDAPLVPELIALLERAPVGISRALAEIGPPAREALPVLARILDGPEGESRIAAAEAIVRIGGDRARALDVLVKALAIPRRANQPNLNQQAAYAIGRLGEAGKPAVEALARATAGERSRDSDAIPALIALWRVAGVVPDVLANPPSAWFFDYPGAEFARAFGEMGPAAAPAVGALQRIALGWVRARGRLDPDVATSRDAIRALGRIGPAARAALPTLDRLRHNALFRATAVGAIAKIEGR